MNRIVQIAKTCHEVNKAFCESIGDFSQPNWGDAPEWQQQSAINGVEYHLLNPNSTPADSHNNWMTEKLKEGWVYGTEKSPDKKEHPCLVSYDTLPKEQQTKDLLFISVVRSFEESVISQETTSEVPDQDLIHRLDALELFVEMDKSNEEPNVRVTSLEIFVGMKHEGSPEVPGQELIHRVDALERFTGMK